MGLLDFLGIGQGARAVEAGANIAEKATGGIINGIDKLFYTEEEKAEAGQKTAATILSFWQTFATENSEQSKARRELAMMVFKSYFALIFMAVAVYGFNDKYASFIFSIVAGLSTLVMMVAGVYFLPHQLSKLDFFKRNPVNQAKPQK